MFTRPDESYDLSKNAVTGVLQDVAQPLHQISKLIPDGSVVLDIGAGNGILGQIFKEIRKKVTIDAIEPNRYAAELAKNHYRNVYQGFAQEFYKEIKEIKYDFIVLADVVEHISDPVSFLSELQNNLSKETKIVISLPNIAFGGVRLSLNNGFFEYVDSGLLEKTHLRFFTLASAQKIFGLLNLKADRIIFSQRSFYRVEFKRDVLRASLFNILKLATKADARAYQYVFVLNQSPDNNQPRMSYHGATCLNILLDAIFYRNFIKTIVRVFRK